MKIIAKREQSGDLECRFPTLIFFSRRLAEVSKHHWNSQTFNVKIFSNIYAGGRSKTSEFSNISSLCSILRFIRRWLADNQQSELLYLNLIVPFQADIGWYGVQYQWSNVAIVIYGAFQNGYCKQFIKPIIYIGLLHWGGTQFHRRSMELIGVVPSIGMLG